jgi:hypothetical protein
MGNWLLLVRVRLLGRRVVDLVLLDDVGQFFPLQVVGERTCNLSFLNCWLALLRI